MEGKPCKKETLMYNGNREKRLLASWLIIMMPFFLLWLKRRTISSFHLKEFREAEERDKRVSGCGWVVAESERGLACGPRALADANNFLFFFFCLSLLPPSVL